MEINFIAYLEGICRKSICHNGSDTLLSLETFFCDPSINIQQFAELTNWWIKEKQLSYLIPAKTLLHHIMLIHSNHAQMSHLSDQHLMQAYNV